MNFDAYVRRHAQVLLDALTSHAATSARTELDELRAVVDRQVAALHKALSHPDQSDLLERLVKDLSGAALKEAETMATLARRDAEKAAEMALAAARAEAQAQMAAVQTVNTELLVTIDEARQQIQEVQAAGKAEVERIRRDLQKISAALAGAEHDTAAARSDAQANASSLQQTQAQVLRLEQERSQILLARDETGTQLEAATRRADELAETLEAARQQVNVAQGEAEARSNDFDRANAQLRALEELRLKLEADLHQRAAAEEARQAAGARLLDRVGVALGSIDVATTGGEILEALIDQLGHDFARAAVFLIGPSSFKGWRGRGFGPTTDISSIVIPRTMDSLLARALADRKPLSVVADANRPTVGLSGSPVERAVALPVLAGGRVIAVAYAEGSDESSAADPDLACRIAQILIDHSNMRFSARRQTSGQIQGQTAQEVDRLGGVTDQDVRVATYSPARRAHRVKMHDGLEVSLDGFAGFLVDLSTVGAQVLSSLAMGPNRLVRMTLHAEEGAIACKGRVVWALLEQSRGTSAARYRAGVQFTEIDLQAIQTFLARHGGEVPEGVLQATKLEDTA